MLGRESLMPYYALNNALALNFNGAFDMDTLDNLMPWEFDLHVYFVEQHVKEKNEAINKAGGAREYPD